MSKPVPDKTNADNRVLSTHREYILFINENKHRLDSKTLREIIKDIKCISVELEDELFFERNRQSIGAVEGQLKKHMIL